MNGRPGQGAGGAMAGLRSRWQALPSRDRFALQLLLLFIAAVAVWWLAWQPAREALRIARIELDEARALNAHLQRNAPVLAARRAAAAVPAERARTLLAGSAARHGLQAEVSAPTGDRVRVALAEASPANVAAWLAELEASGVATGEVSMTALPGGGWQVLVELVVPVG